MQDAAAHKAAAHDAGTMDDGETPLNVSIPVALAMALPWIAYAMLTLEGAWRIVAVADLLALAALLSVAGRMSYATARRRGLDATRWSAAAPMTLGLSVLLLAFARAPRLDVHLQFLCHGCGSLGDAREPFCVACGAYP